MSTLAREIEQGGERPSLYKTLFATCIGNALEWFDIAVYGFFASYIAHAFFPTVNPTVSLLLAFGSFGVAFLIRPLGAVVLGAYADKHGRKASLLLSINLMMLGGAMITFMPGYATLGVAAPLLILVARLIQGSLPVVSLVARPRFWWSTSRSEKRLSPAGSLQRRAQARCWRPRLVSGWRSGLPRSNSATGVGVFRLPSVC